MTHQQISQGDVVGFLSEPASYDPAPDDVEIVETHGAFVFLAGDTAYKIKRDVAYDYMDFSTLEKREAVIRRELEINRRQAPRIYLGVLPVTQEPEGGLALGGSGTPVEWVLRMRRFAEEDVLERVAERGEFTLGLAHRLGDRVARLHAETEPVEGLDGRELMEEIVDELTRVYAGLENALGEAATHAFERGCRAELDRVGGLLRERADAGAVRRCHGDLHLRNLVLFEGEIVPFDALEFDDRLATTDVLYDLAFLLMDLVHRKLPVHANLVFNRYFSHSREVTDLNGLAALPLFLAVRAGIRAMVTAQAALHDEARAAKLRTDARTYMREALNFLEKSPPRVVAVGGLSGTGKSTLAAALAPLIGALPGALHLRSDVERKRLFQAEETARLGEKAYRPEVTEKVYAHLAEKARTALVAGHSVVLDAVYQQERERRAAEEAAKASGAPFTGLWLDADLAVLVERVTGRKGDASDADEAIVRLQAERDAGPVSWKRIEAGGTAEETLERALKAAGP